MDSITTAELTARFLAEEQALDARARAVVLRRQAGRSMTSPSRLIKLARGAVDGWIVQPVD